MRFSALNLPRPAGVASFPRRTAVVPGAQKPRKDTQPMSGTAADQAFEAELLEALKKIQGTGTSSGGKRKSSSKAKASDVEDEDEPIVQNQSVKGMPRVQVIDGDAMVQRRKKAEQAAMKQEEEEEEEEEVFEDVIEDEAGQFVRFGFDGEGDVEEGDDEEGRAVHDAGADWAMDQDEDEAPGPSGRPRNSVSMEVKAFDTARIYVQAGEGGRGCVAFRREKFVPRGGPSGGNGGRGGHVWAVADSSLNSLMFFRRQLHYRAQPGNPGEGKNCHGADGEDTVIRVPPGTVIRRRDADEDEAPLAELLEDGERALLAVGGRGGRGNTSFKTSNNRAPIMAEKGEAGQQYWLELELKLVADVGIVGVPNAGKSTLLSVITAAKPKIADYPFTTLTPNLGVCEMDMRTTVFADIPGLLEGAHTGKGLGQEFLRHCERTRLLVHVIDGTSKDPLHDFNAINLELEMFSPELADKPQVVAYNKMDLADSADYYDLVCDYFKEHGMDPPIAISAATGRGVVDLVRRVHAILDILPEDEVVRTTTNVTERPRRTQSASRIDDFEIDVDFSDGGRVFIVEGEALERFAQMTNFDYYESLKRFQKVLQAAGVESALRKAGVVEGDTVVIGELEMQWSDDRSERGLFDAWKRIRGENTPVQGSRSWPSPYALD